MWFWFRAAYCRVRAGVPILAGGARGISPRAEMPDASDGLMNHMPTRAEAPSPPPDAAPLQSPAGLPAALRATHRAAAELKRGVPVRLRGARDWLILPVETAGADGLRDMAAAAAGPAMLLLAASRAAGLLPAPIPPGAAVALGLPSLLTDPALLRGLADPTAEQMLPAAPFPAVDCPPDAEAAIALAKLARLLPAMLMVPAAAANGADLLSVSAADVLASRHLPVALVRVAEAAVPLEGAPDARVVAFRAPDAGIEHLAILIGRPEQAGAPLVRIHSECFTGDLLGSLRCDCGPQLHGAIRRMGEEGAGVLLYLAHEGRGIGLVNKLRAYAMQDRGLDTVDANRALGWGADERNFLVAATMLDALAIHRVRLLTNNPAKVAALVACGIDVQQREQIAIPPNGVNDFYLSTKAGRMGHLFD